MKGEIHVEDDLSDYWADWEWWRDWKMKGGVHLRVFFLFLKQTLKNYFNIYLG